ncbi:MAG: ABC transporter ATP-binding protein [Planctomycetota bacterium]|jgi:predicted ABC-type transport system involved in lysophospholipase L1 biosynthesis ATPase subunit
MTDGPLLKLIGVSKHYESPGGGEPLRVLEDITWALAGGEAVAVTGPSGSGKSTLLNIIAALERPNAGSVRLAGEDLAALSDKQLSLIRNRHIGLVFQLHHLLPQCTVLENVLIPTLAVGGADGEAERHARRLLDRVGLTGRLSHFPGQLSGGECQRVATVRALVNKPKLILADEPTGSLDRAAAENLADLLVELNREEGTTLIVATHSAALAERIGNTLELRDGKLTAGDKGA